MVAGGGVEGEGQAGHVLLEHGAQVALQLTGDLLVAFQQHLLALDLLGERPQLDLVGACQGGAGAQLLEFQLQRLGPLLRLGQLLGQVANLLLEGLGGSFRPILGVRRLWGCLCAAHYPVFKAQERRVLVRCGGNAPAEVSGAPL